MPVPSTLSGTYCTIYRSASTLPSEFWEAARTNPAHFNTILPTAQKCRDHECPGYTSAPGHVWILVWTCSPRQQLELVLSCTSTEMGTYPIFIASTVPTPRLTQHFVSSRIPILASTLHQEIPKMRVYSVFGPDAIVNCFAPIWSSLTGISPYREPYYAAKLSVCTSRTISNRSASIIPGLQMDLRLAVTADLQGVAELCYGFASESAPFTLTREGALKEASYLIQNKQVWVHGIRQEGTNGPSEIASIVACTRNAEQCATITKVYTNPRWRRRGCAERLVRRVTKLLLSSRYEKVALYVAHTNPAAAKVYHRVGFAGLGDDSMDGKNCEHWSEIGFDRKVVDLGHW
ncbi:hypothetical protein BDZ89DRAFT_1022759 [Hymenopellis radicata]|nr:hypothetical protein BDZ89DRAFT_1022759 [Hymenopellis radicata]